MIQNYSFFHSSAPDDTIAFDDEKSVAELVRSAFAKFGYFAPCGMDIVTVFQGCADPRNNNCNINGWFITDTSKKCAEEILNRERLCFAYYLPGVFYFAEGGWGHHMPDLGNHPELPDPVQLNLRFEDFDETVMVNGNYSFSDVINYLKTNGYITESLNRFPVLCVGTGKDFTISIDDPAVQKPLSELKDTMDLYYKQKFPNGGFVYYYIFDLGRSI